jgi:hypothetical protein
MPFKDWLDFSFAWPNPGEWLCYALRSEASNADMTACLQWQDTKLHGTAAVALLQWQDAKLHARMAALLQWQVFKLLE